MKGLAGVLRAAPDPGGWRAGMDADDYAHLEVAVLAHLREWLGSTDVREAVARTLAEMEPGEEWPTNETLGGNPTGTRDDEYRAAMQDTATAALAAVAMTLPDPRPVGEDA